MKRKKEWWRQIEGMGPARAVQALLVAFQSGQSFESCGRLLNRWHKTRMEPHYTEGKR